MEVDPLKITVEGQPKSEEKRRIFDGVRRHNVAHTNDGGCVELAIFLRDAEGVVVGGILGETYWGWLHIEFMWIEDAFRARGFGRELLAAAEREAAARGCRAAFLDTFSFQALEFYRKSGYEVFGSLDDFPQAHKRFFMRKSLRPAAA